MISRSDADAFDRTRILDSPFLDARRLGNSIAASGDKRCRLGGQQEHEGNTRPDGPFGGWELHSDRVEAWTDPYGFFPVFYWSTGGSIQLSSSLVRLLAAGAPADLDEDGLAVFLQLGYFIGEHTPFRAIKVLPPNGRLVWRGERPSVTGELTIPRPAGMSRDDAIDAYIEAFSAAVRRSVPTDDFVVPLSGGKDSRHVLLELCKIGARPRLCVTLRHPPGTWPPKPNEDAEIAAQVTSVLGIDHHVLDPPQSRLSAELRKNLLTHFCADEHGWLMPMVDFIDGRFAYVYDGIGGGVLSSGAFLTPERLAMFERGQSTSLANELCETSYLSNMLPKRPYRRMNRERAIELVAQELRRHQDAPNPLGSFYFWNRTRREVSLLPCALLGSVASVRTPFIDGGVFRLLASLPASMLVDRQFHTDAIARAHPQYARLPYHAGSSYPERALAQQRHFATELARYVLHSGGLASRRFVAPRLVRALLDSGYAKEIGAYGPAAAYLIQLGRVAGGLWQLATHRANPN